MAALEAGCRLVNVRAAWLFERWLAVPPYFGQGGARDSYSVILCSAVDCLHIDRLQAATLCIRGKPQGMRVVRFIKKLQLLTAYAVKAARPAWPVYTVDENMPDELPRATDRRAFHNGRRNDARRTGVDASHGWVGPLCCAWRGP